MKFKFLLLLLFPTFLWAQSSFLENNLSLSEVDSNSTKLTLSGKAFELLGYAQPDVALTPELIKMANGISGMLGYKDISIVTAKKLLAKINTEKSLQEFASATQNDDSFWVFMDEENGIVNRVLVVAWKNDKAAVGEIYGAFDLKLMGELMKMIPFHELRKPQDSAKI